MKSNIIIVAILVLITFGVYLNQIEKAAVDRSKIPEKVESSQGFNRWITNLKNKGFDVEADEFRLKEENEIYNTKWLTITSVDKSGAKEKYENQIAKHQDLDRVIFSPSERQFVDFRDIERDGYLPNEVHFYGLRDDKILNARLVDCSVNANCYFDRAFFLEDSNDVIVVSEFSRNIHKHEESPTPCAITQVCTYSIKLHVIDLLRNSRLVYESNPFDINLQTTKKEL